MALIFHFFLKMCAMADKQDSRNTPYRGERSTEPHNQTGNINFQNNNVEASTPGAVEPNVESASDSGIGDQAVNDQKLTNFTSNHSADA
jgi:hypothetical protein